LKAGLTPEYIASKLALLPRFKVVSIDHESEEQGLDLLLVGSFSTPVELHEQGATLFTKDLRTIYGTLLEATSEDRFRTFRQRPHYPTDIPLDELQHGHLAFFADYDERHLRLVLDLDYVWEEISYSARPEIHSRVLGTDGIPLRKLEEFIEGTPVPDGSTIVEGG
jgi:hypothetical protein